MMDKMKSKSVIGKRNKRKGSEGERYYASKFRDLGFEHCKTSRLGSRLHDNCGIDLIFIPFNTQVKVGVQRGLNISNELENMQIKMLENFPNNSVEHNLPKILIHKKPVGQGKKSTEYHELVTMTFEDFSKIIKKVEKWE